MMEAPHAQLADAFERLDKMATIIRWTSPNDLPTHRSRLRDAVERGHDEYPHAFVYDPVDLDPLHRTVEEVLRTAQTVDDAELREAIEESARRIERRAAAAAARVDEAWTTVCQELDGLPTLQSLETADKLLRESPITFDEDLELTTDDLAAALTNALNEYGLNEWRIEVSERMAASMSTNGAKRLLRLREGLTLSRRQVNRLVVHEVGGHVLRWENSRAQACDLARLPLGSTVETEEGLAVHLEEQLGVSDLTQLRLYAARAKAVEIGSTEGIMTLASHLRPLVGTASAIDISLRMKRGMVDPNQPGGTTKDHAYLSGFLSVRELDNTSQDVLRSTKWSANYLDLQIRLAKEGSLQLPALVPSRRRLLRDEQDLNRPASDGGSVSWIRPR